MNSQKTEQSAHETAKQKVEFRIHLVTYILVNSLLLTLNLTLTPNYFWFIWPLMGWGIGIVLHAINVSNAGKASLMDRMVENEMRKNTGSGNETLNYR